MHLFVEWERWYATLSKSEKIPCTNNKSSKLSEEREKESYLDRSFFFGIINLIYYPINWIFFNFPPSKLKKSSNLKKEKQVNLLRVMKNDKERKEELEYRGIGRLGNCWSWGWGIHLSYFHVPVPLIIPPTTTTPVVVAAAATAAGSTIIVGGNRRSFYLFIISTVAWIR